MQCLPGLRWELSFSIFDSNQHHSRLLYDSPPLPITETSEAFHWRDLNIHLPEMSLMYRDIIQLHMNFHPVKENGERGRILWFPFFMQYTSLVFHMSNTVPTFDTVKKGENTFIFTYYDPLDKLDITTLNLLMTGEMHVTRDKKRFAKFRICHATLTTCVAYLQHLIELEQKFRIVCLTELSYRDPEKNNKMIKALTLYLSRPQRIECVNGKDRLYVWQTTEEDGSPFKACIQRGCRDGLKLVEDHNDMVRLRIEPPITGKERTHTVLLPDNEALTNTSMAWPIIVKPGQTFTAKFFNMELEDCAKCGVEIVVKWNDYIHTGNAKQVIGSAEGLFKGSAYKRLSLDFLYKQRQQQHVKVSKYFKVFFDVGNGLKVEIEYEPSGNDEFVSIYAIYLHASNYHYTLQFMNSQPLKSV
ncbi:MAG: hypothetical protein K2Q45_03170 [Nitrosomonas sp.]|nr:hypothetical protein [Nitrosomonas sp.]